MKTSHLTSIFLSLKFYHKFMLELSLTERENSTRKYILTNRETEVLCLVGLGFKNLEIAKILNIQICTVKKFLETIFLKIHAKNRTHALTIAFLHDIITKDILNQIYTKYINIKSRS